MEKGIESSREVTEVKRVPTMKGKAPNLPATGSHTSLVKNLKPNFEIDGMDDKKSVRKMQNTRKINVNPEIFKIHLKAEESPLFEP
jgi:hypothetical protein